MDVRAPNLLTGMGGFAQAKAVTAFRQRPQQEREGEGYGLDR